MATKKATPKKAVKPAKAAAKPAPKGGSKAAAPKKAAPAPRKNVKPAPAKQKTVSAKPLPAKTATVHKPAPVKKAAPAKVEKAPAEPVKKPSVHAASQQSAKAATKPLETKTAEKEPAKPSKIVVPKTTTDKSVKYEPDFTRSVLDSSAKQDENKPMARYSDAELAEFRDLINRKLDVAKKELAYLQGLITRKDESGDLDEGRYMTMEDGSMSMEREQLSQMASRQIQFIDHLEKALMRIENKTYGICRVTGKLIDKARLRAVPHATLSIEAKQMMNK